MKKAISFLFKKTIFGLLLISLALTWSSYLFSEHGWMRFWVWFAGQASNFALCAYTIISHRRWMASRKDFWFWAKECDKLSRAAENALLIGDQEEAEKTRAALCVAYGRLKREATK